MYCMLLNVTDVLYVTDVQTESQMLPGLGVAIVAKKKTNDIITVLQFVNHKMSINFIKRNVRQIVQPFCDI